MAFKHFTLGSGVPVTVYKRRTSRSLRLSVTAQGQVRVSIPHWVPYDSGLKFAVSRQSWIEQQLPAAPALLADNQVIGKSHRLFFIKSYAADKPRSRIKQTEIIISCPAALEISDSAVQLVASKACVRALRSQAEGLLPIRLKTLADKHGFRYGSISIKRLKRRWGSCDQHQNIVLNLFLMQLPWDCIDYVLLHELVHTRVMQHGPKFWAEMELVVPELKQIRRTMRSYQPILHANPLIPVA